MRTSVLSALIEDHLAGAASRLAALLLPRILPVCSVVAPCHPGAAGRDLALVQRRQATRACLVAVALVLGCAARAGAATLFDPLLRFRVLATPHFRIYFHQNEDRLAARLGTIAESAWQALEKPFGVRPPPLTHVVLADQTDLSNGYATPLPYDTIVIFAVWPPGAEFDTDDWLRLVFTHEFTHIVHLDRSRGWARAVRGVFGRTPIAFPNLFLPTWQIEGLATYQESAITGEGRLHAGEFRAITDEAARRHALEPLDRVNGGLTDWPSGQGPYAYGLAFHQYLVDRFGGEKLAALADATAGRLPYTASPIFRRIYGASLGDLWRDFERTTAANVTAATDDPAIARLTRHGFVAAGPRFDRASCAGSGASAGGPSARGGPEASWGGPSGPPCSPAIVYAKRTPDAFPSLERIAADGSAPTELATRFLGATSAPGADAIYFDQLEVRRNVGLYGDIYALARDTGRVRPVTHDQRLHDPDLSPDVTRLVCVQDRPGQRVLVTVRLKANATIELLIAADDTQFNAPRWSPDGRLIAVERHRRGFDPEIVVVDVATREVRIVARRDKTRITMPTWRPDGRALVAALAPDDEPFNLYEFSLDGATAPRQLTHVSGGATWPEIAPDGRTLIFVGYSVDGYDLFSIPYPPDEAPATAGAEQARPLQPTNASVATAPSGSVGAELARPFATRPYSPLPTLKPTSWSPEIEWTSEQVRIGAATFGRDVLGYHNYAASATWLAASPSGSIAPPAHVPDWFVSYAYDRWRPTLIAAASSETSFFAGPATDAGTPSSATRRERVVEGGVVLPFVRTRHSHTALATLFRAVDDYTLVDREFSRNRSAVRGAWRSQTARTYGYSVSQEDGVLVGGTVEVVDRALGASADATTVTVDARAFLPAFAPHHVIAARLAGGRSTGDPIVGRTFVLGGSAPDASVIDFGSGAASLLRGFESNSFAGSRVALANVEYRWPIARPQRGVGTWPLFLHTIHAAAFADAGHAWTRTFRSSAVKTSVGAELSANVVAGFSFPLTLTMGVAWGHDGSGTIPGGTIVYFRTGKSF